MTNATRKHGTALAGIVEINTGIQRGLAGFLPPLPPGAYSNEQQSANQKSGRHHVSQDADVWAGSFRNEADQGEQKNIAQTD
jgi:hypothetical protein